jgi:ATP-dependent Lon protease
MTMKDIFNEMLTPPGGAEVSIIPVMQGDALMKLNESELPDSLPILALRNAVLFPGSVFPITIGREKSIRLIEDAEKNNAFIGAVPQNDLSIEDPRKEDLYTYGTVAKIVKTLEMPDGTITAILQGFKRFEIDSIVEYEPYMLGRVRYQDDFVPENDNKTKMIAESLKEKATLLIRMSGMVAREAATAIKSIDNFEFLVNFIATTIEVENFMDKVELLQFGDLRTRAMELLSVLDTQLELQKIKQEINQQVKTEIDQLHRVY